MSKFLIAFFTFVVSATYFVANGASPFQPHVEDRFQKIEYGSRVLKKFRHSFTASNAASGDSITLGNLPAEAVLMESYVFTNDALVSGSDNTVTISCESTGDIVDASASSAFIENDIVAGDITSKFDPVWSSDGCDLVMTIGSGTTGITEGILTTIVEYLLPNKVK